MNKRYMDFVPVEKKTAAVPVRNGAPRRIKAPKITRRVTDEPFDEMADDIALEEMFEEKARPAGVSTGLPEDTKLGVIEDYRPKFVKTDVKKRPLGASNAARGVGAGKTSATEKANVAALGKANAATVKNTNVKTASKGPSMASKGLLNTQSRNTAAKTEIISKAAVKPPKAKIVAPVRANFINTNKIEKRPLSTRGADTRQPIVAASKKAAKEEREKPEKPVRIIEKTDKDSKAGMIVAVILTIILGAAAGTVAFLLLPK